MIVKRICTIILVILITVACLIFMNRNYDPLARWNYDDENLKEIIIERLDERQIKYIVDYQISPSEIREYISNPSFLVYHLSSYQKVRAYLYNLNTYEIVDICELFLQKGIDIDNDLEDYSFMTYQEIKEKLANYD